MTSLLKAVGQLMGRTASDQPVIDKLDTLNYIEEVSDTLHALKDAMTDARVQSTFANIVKNPKPATDYDRIVKTAHDLYTKALPSTVQVIERREAFGSLLSAINVGLDDLALIKDGYADLFGGTQSSDLKSSDVKMASVVTLGYLGALMDLTTWTVYLLNAGLSSVEEDASKIPPYQISFLHDQADGVAKTVAEIFNRLNGESFMSLIEAMRRRGRDVYVETNGHTIDQYADDQDYTPAELVNANHFMRSPALMIGQAYINYRQAQYDKMKSMRGWLATKVGLLNLQLSQQADKDSPEYHRLEKIIQNYSAQISTYDKKISRHEH